MTTPTPDFPKTDAIHMDVRERATCLAALRLWQRVALQSEERLPEDDIASSGGEFGILQPDEVEALCDRINTRDRTEPSKASDFDTIRIAIHQGHGLIAKEPDWTGTIAEYWVANPELTFGDITEMLADLKTHWFHRIGGGAQGCFTIRHAVPKPEERVTMVCRTCGGSNVMRDAWAEWDDEAQAWGLGSVFDQAHCDDCGGETRIDEIPLTSESDDFEESALPDTARSAQGKQREHHKRNGWRRART